VRRPPNKSLETTRVNVGKIRTGTRGARLSLAIEQPDVPLVRRRCRQCASTVKATGGFTADTPVATADGAEAIGDIDIGDLVLLHSPIA
jgi:hypothetical protein